MEARQPFIRRRARAQAYAACAVGRAECRAASLVGAAGTVDPPPPIPGPRSHGDKRAQATTVAALAAARSLRERTTTRPASPRCQHHHPAREGGQSRLCFGSGRPGLGAVWARCRQAAAAGYAAIAWSAATALSWGVGGGGRGWGGTLVCMASTVTPGCGAL